MKQRVLGLGSFPPHDWLLSRGTSCKSVCSLIRTTDELRRPVAVVQLPILVLRLYKWDWLFCAPVASIRTGLEVSFRRACLACRPSAKNCSKHEASMSLALASLSWPREHLRQQNAGCCWSTTESTCANAEVCPLCSPNVLPHARHLTVCSRFPLRA